MKIATGLSRHHGLIGPGDSGDPDHFLAGDHQGESLATTAGYLGINQDILHLFASTQPQGTDTVARCPGTGDERRLQPIQVKKSPARGRLESSAVSDPTLDRTLRKGVLPWNRQNDRVKSSFLRR